MIGPVCYEPASDFTITARHGDWQAVEKVAVIHHAIFPAVQPAKNFWTFAGRRGWTPRDLASEPFARGVAAIGMSGTTRREGNQARPQVPW